MQDFTGDSAMDRSIDSSAGTGSVFLASGHDHQRCIADAIASAQAVCGHRGARFTKLRKRVLELIWASHHPVGAYDLLERLGNERGRVAPPTVYRVLEFLTGHGLVHRIDSLNAFVGCAHPGQRHRAYFLICRMCRCIAEIDDEDLGSAVERCAGVADFVIERETIELLGLCPRCQQA